MYIHTRTHTHDREDVRLHLYKHHLHTGVLGNRRRLMVVPAVGESEGWLREWVGLSEEGMTTNGELERLLHTSMSEFRLQLLELTTTQQMMKYSFNGLYTFFLGSDMAFLHFTSLLFFVSLAKVKHRFLALRFK